MIRNTLCCLAGAICLLSSMAAAPVTGGTTVVTLDTGTVTTLTGLGFSIASVAPATLGGTPLAAAFPVTGGDTTTMIDHTGGLAFTKGGVTADIHNFIINLSGSQANTITGQLVAGGSTTDGVALFDIGSGLALTLDAQLAGIISGAFGVPDLTGAAIGTAAINAASSTPEPAGTALLGLGLLGAVVLFCRRFNVSA